MIGVTLIVMIFALILLGVPIFAALGATGTMGLIFLQSRSASGGYPGLPFPSPYTVGLLPFPFLQSRFSYLPGKS